MSNTIQPSHIPSDDSSYQSDEDSDFAPEKAKHITTLSASEGEGEHSESADSEDEREDEDVTRKEVVRALHKRQRGTRHDEAEDLGFANSGDEAIIGKGLKRVKRKKEKRRKKTRKEGGDEVNDDTDDGDDDDDDEGGEGGFVKTRAMRAAAVPEETRTRLPIGQTTVDIDAVWQSMISAPLKPSKTTSTPQPIISPSDDTAQATPSSLPPPSHTQPLESDDTITITRTFNFAGVLQTETKRVPRYSAEAKLYLASLINKDAKPDSNPIDTTNQSSAHQIRRPVVRRSRFEPVIPDPPQPRTDLRFKTTSYIPPATLDITKAALAKKLNTVEKSAMDWAAFVDKEDIAEDLDAASKRKGTYLDNRAFLNRAEQRQEEEARKARLSGVVK